MGAKQRCSSSAWTECTQSPAAAMSALTHICVPVSPGEGRAAAPAADTCSDPAQSTGTITGHRAQPCLLLSCTHTAQPPR